MGLMNNFGLSSSAASSSSAGPGQSPATQFGTIPPHSMLQSSAALMPLAMSAIYANGSAGGIHRSASFLHNSAAPNSIPSNRPPIPLGQSASIGALATAAAGTPTAHQQQQQVGKGRKRINKIGKFMNMQQNNNNNTTNGPNTRHLFDLSNQISTNGGGSSVANNALAAAVGSNPDGIFPNQSQQQQQQRTTISKKGKEATIIVLACHITIFICCRGTKRATTVKHNSTGFWRRFFNCEIGDRNCRQNIAKRVSLMSYCWMLGP